MVATSLPWFFSVLRTKSLLKSDGSCVHPCIRGVYKGKGQGEDEWQAQGYRVLEKDREGGEQEGSFRTKAVSKLKWAERGGTRGTKFVPLAPFCMFFLTSSAMGSPPKSFFLWKRVKSFLYSPLSEKCWNAWSWLFFFFLWISLWNKLTPFWFQLSVNKLEAAHPPPFFFFFLLCCSFSRFKMK